MVGIKGRSGRKARDDGWIARAVALYIPSFVSSITKHGKKQYLTVSWFRLFKKIYGTRATAVNPYNWQEKVRMLIKAEVFRYTDHNGWWCECHGDRLVRWHFQHDPQCNECGYEPRKLERYRTVASARTHTIEPKTPKEQIKNCPTCEKALVSRASKFGTLWYCNKCDSAMRSKE